MLEVKRLSVFYGEVQALHNVNICVDRHEIVSIIGANGAGKTTLMKTIMGENKGTGEILFNDIYLNNMHTHEIVKEGVIYIPEGRKIFYELSVKENIEMGAYARKLRGKPLKEELEKVLDIFPQLRERLTQSGGTLSGGEQQMLAIARGLMGAPKLLMLDEPSLGLAPLIVDEVFDIIQKVNKVQKIPIILVEQNAFMALEVSQRTYVLELGQVAQQGKSSDLLQSEEIKKSYLGG